MYLRMKCKKIKTVITDHQAHQKLKKEEEGG
jgi:hypothetical protein